MIFCYAKPQTKLYTLSANQYFFFWVTSAKQYLDTN